MGERGKEEHRRSCVPMGSYRLATSATASFSWSRPVGTPRGQTRRPKARIATSLRSAGRVKKACDAAAFGDQTVVLVDCGRGLVPYDGDLVFLEQRESRRRCLEAKLTPSTQHDDVGIVLEQLDEVGC